MNTHVYTNTQYELVKNLIEQGKTNKDIVSIVGCRSIYVSMIRKKFNLQPCVIKKKLDWKKVQEYYNQGHTLKEVAEYFEVGLGRIVYGTKHKNIITRTNSETLNITKSRRKKHKHTEEVKNIIREKHIRYMQEHPDETAWARRWKHEKSWPEKIFEEELIRRNIKGWLYNFRSSIYEYDFGFPDLKLDVEIDGSWHNNERQKHRDRLRDEYTLNNGWVVIRFSAKEVNNNLSGCVDSLEKLVKLLTCRRMVNPFGSEPRY